MMTHDLRLQYTHRHNYSFVSRCHDGNRYLFSCNDCARHGFNHLRAIAITTFWKEGRSTE